MLSWLDRLPYFRRNGVLGEYAVLVHVAVCLIRGPTIATAVTFFVMAPLLASFAAPTGWSSAAVFAASSTLVHEVIFGGFLLLTSLADRYQWFTQYRLPRSKRQETAPAHVAYVAKRTAFLHLIVQPISLYVIFWAIADGDGVLSPTRSITDQSWFEVWRVFFFLNIGNEVLTYAIHSNTHRPFLYRNIHKAHHTFVGAQVVGGEHAHAIEYVVGTQLTVAAYCAGDIHVAIWLVWVAWKVWETSELHSGYDFSKTLLGRLGLLMGRMARYHDHHHTVNKGNFGSLQFMDFLFGTMGPFLEHIDREKKERARAVA